MWTLNWVLYEPIWKRHRFVFTPKQECIPVGCVPPAHWPTVSRGIRPGGGGRACRTCPSSHAHPPAMHTPQPCTHPSHACPPTTHAPLAMHTPWHAHLPATHAPPAIHTPLAMHAPGHAPSQSCTPPPPPAVDRILDTRFWKYYLAPNFACGR